MSMRRDNRVAAMQFIYQWQLNPAENLAAGIASFFENQEKPREFYSFGEELAVGAIQNLEEIDKVIKEYAKNWEFDRIARVDLAVLRLAIHEMLHRKDIPPIVSINEAIDIVKEYSSEDSRRFLNGILDQFKKTLNRPLRSSQ